MTQRHQSARKRRLNRKNPRPMALEQRLMFDGAGAADAAAAIAAEQAAHAMQETAAVDRTAVDPAPPAVTAEASAPLPREIVFVDGALPNAVQLANNVRPGAQVIVFDGRTDGLAQIAAALQGRTDIGAIHILSHGESGRVSLGTTQLDQAALQDDSVKSVLRDIGTHLAADGDILLYGCSVGSGTAGQTFISQLAQLTQADVAASIDETGSASLGGDWQLETQSGSIETSALDYADNGAPFILGVPTVAGLSNASYTEQAAPISVTSGLTLTGGGSYADGYLRFSIGSATSSETLSLLTSGTPNATGGAVSIVDGKAYLGEGGSYKQIGAVDGIENGQNGQALKILLSNPLENASFEQGGATSGPVVGWTINDSAVLLPSNRDGNADRASDNMTFSHEVQGAQRSVGSYALRLVSTGNIVGPRSSASNTGNGTIHGPSATSSAFQARAGDTISVDWSAIAGDDWYDVYGYLINVDTGVKTVLFSDRGQSRAWTTTSTVIAATGNYQFEFLAGTYDQSGGLATGASLYIDNIRVVTTGVTDSVVQQVGRLVQYANSSDNPAASRTLTVQARATDGNTGTATSTINITAVDDPTTLTLSRSAANYTENDGSFFVDANLTVTDPDNTSATGARVVIGTGFVAAEDRLAFTNTANLTGSYNTSTGILTVTGTAAFSEFQTFLRSVKYSNLSENPTTTPRDITLSIGGAIGMSINGTNHYYEYVSTPSTWTAAKAAAAGRTYNGMTGYLATITSQSENDFIKQKLGADAWIGASDAASEGASEGNWKWVTGPESGQTLNSTFSYWNPDEPNNSGGNEHYAEIYASGSNPGRWNDLPNSSTLGYVVEYNDVGGTPAFAKTITITPQRVNDAPVKNASPTVTASSDANAGNDFHPGHTLTATNGTWTDVDGDTAFTYTYQWYRADNASGAGETAIAGATGATYLLRDQDAGKFIRVKVTATDSGASGSGGPKSGDAFSAYNQVVNAAPTIAAISNLRMAENTPTVVALSATDPDGDSITYTVKSSDNRLTATIEGGNLVLRPIADTSISTATTIEVTATDRFGGNSKTTFQVTEVARASSLTGSAGSVTHYATSNAGTVVDSGLVVTGGGNITGAKVMIGSQFTTGDTLSWDSSRLPNGISGSYNGTTGVLTFTGSATAAQWQDLLRTVKFSTNSVSNGNARSVVFNLGTAISYSGNGHYYEFVSAAGITWTSAKNAAEARSFNGMKGYLATITSAGENAFISEKVSGSAWIGATDAAVEGTWRWVTGPEAGSLVQGYTNWNVGEPNNSGGNEDYAHMMSWTPIPGQWNDLPDTGGGGQYAATGYVVEYGGMAGDPSVQISTTRTVRVDLPPAAMARTVAAIEDTGQVITLSGTDPEGAPLTYTITQLPTNGTLYRVNADGSRGSAITAANTVVTDSQHRVWFEPAANANGNNYANFRYSVSDGTLSSSATVTVNVAAVNDAPTDIALSSYAVAENSPNGTVVGNLSATDVDSGSFTYSLVTGTGDADNGKFVIVGNQLRVNGPIDFEAQPTYSIRVRVSDGAATFDKVLTINATDVAEAPVITSTAPTTVAENTSGLIYTPTVTDTENRALTWSISGVDAARFAINSSTGALSLITPADYENPNDAGANRIYNVRLTVTNASGLSQHQDIALEITNVNDAPTDIVLGGTGSSATPANITPGNFLVNGLGGVAGFGETIIRTGDDGFDAIDVSSVFTEGFNFFGKNYSAATKFFIGWNGYVTFGQGSSSYTPAGISQSSMPIIAPMYLDFDTRGGNRTSDNSAARQLGNSMGTNRVYVDKDVANGVVTITFDDVGEYSARTNANAFQIRLYNKGGGNFDIEFRYEYVGWAQHGGWTSAGWSAGDRVNYSEINGSMTSAMANLARMSNIDQAGVFYWQVRNGAVSSGFTSGIDEHNNARPDNSASWITATSGFQAIDQDAGNTHTYSVVGDLADRFAMVNEGGVWKLKVTDGAKINYESDPSPNFDAAGHKYRVTVRATDQGGLFVDKVFEVSVNNINEAPVLATNAGITVNEGGTTVIGSAALRATDADLDTTLTYTVTQLASNGTLYRNGVALGVNGTFTQADLDNNRISYTHNGSETASDAFRFTVSDGSGGTIGTTVFNVTVAAQNDAPVWTLPNTAQAVNAANDLIINGITVSDADAGNNLISVTLSAENGKLTLASTAGLTFVIGDGVADGAMQFRGTVAQINAALAGLRYRNNPGFDSVSAGENERITLVVDDQGNTGAGGPRSDSRTLAVVVRPLPPTAHSANLDGIEDDGGIAINLSQLAEDPNNSAISFRIGQGIGNNPAAYSGMNAYATAPDGSIRLAHGTLRPNGGGGLYVYEADAGWSGIDEFQFMAANTANMASEIATVRFFVAAGNDAPTLVVPGAQTVTEDQPLDFGAGRRIIIGDIDAGNAEMDLTLAVRNGVLTAGVTAGVTFQSGANGSAGFTARGTAGALQALLDSLRYQGAQNFDGQDALSITINDRGNSGAGGGLSASAAVTIGVSPVNDAPVLVASTQGEVAEGGSTVLQGSKLLVSDPEQTPNQIVYTVTALPAQGTLTLSGTALRVGDTFTQDDVDAGRVGYTHNGSETGGTDRFKFTVSDGAGGTIAESAYSLAITPVNDAPVVGTIADVTLAQNTPRTITLSATDAENDTVTYSATSSDPRVSVSIVGNQLTLTPRADATMTAGTPITITVTGDDGHGGTHQRTFQITEIRTATTVNGSGNGALHLATGAATVVDPALVVQGTVPVLGSVVSIDNFQTGDRLTFDANALPPGVTGSYDPARGVLSFSGTATPAQWQAVLRTVAFATSNTTVATPRNISFTAGNALQYNGGAAPHYYEFISAPGIKWTDAKAAAEARTFNGLQGYLATITSAQENDFIRVKVSGTAWIGASDAYDQINLATGTTTYANDAAAEGHWYWITGPEAGTAFFNQNRGGTAPYTQGGGGGSAVGGEYNNWQRNGSTLSEPNQSGNEDYAHMMSWTAVPGQWNDLPNAGGGGNYRPTGYIVEYGGMAGDPVIRVTANGTVNVHLPPVITSPATTSVAENTSTAAVVHTLTATDHEGQAITWAIGGPDATRFTLDTATGQLRFAVAPDYEAPVDANRDNIYEVTVSATDTEGLVTTQTLRITVANINEAPTLAANLGLTVSEGTTVTVTNAQLRVTDQDRGQALTYTVTGAPDNGTLRLNGVALSNGGTFTQTDIDAGRLTYTHNGTETTADGFSFTATDGSFSLNGSFDIGVIPVNDVPVVTMPTDAQVTERTGANPTAQFLVTGISIADSDAGNGIVTVTIASRTLATGAYGTLTVRSDVVGGLGAGNITGNGSGSVILTGTLAQINATLAAAGGLNYAANPGNDVVVQGFDMLTVTVDDAGLSGSGGPRLDTRSVPVTVLPATPTANSGNAIGAEDAAGIAINLANFVRDLNGTPTSYVLGTGTLGTTDVITEYSGADMIKDGNGNVIGYQLAHGKLMLDGPLHGANYRFIPNADWNGSLTFLYQVSSSNESSEIAQVTLVATPVNDAPTVTTGAPLETREDIPLSLAGRITLADADAGDAGAGEYDLTLSVANGRLTASVTNGITFLRGENGGMGYTVRGSLANLQAFANSLSYQGSLNFNGSDSLSILLDDRGNNGSGSVTPATATLAITITPEADAPVLAVNDTLVSQEGGASPILSNLLQTSDVDTLGGDLVYTVTNPQNGEVRVNGVATTRFTQADLDNGRVSFQHDGSETTTAGFTFSVTDGTTVIANQSFNLTINPVNDAPVANDDAVAIDEDGSATGNVLRNDTDSEGQVLVAELVSGPTDGTLTLNSDGSFVYTPRANFNGVNSFTYRTVDASGAVSGTATVTITVNAVNDAPTVVVNAGQTLAEGDNVTVLNGNLAVGDPDQEVNALTYTLTAVPAHGILAKGGVALAIGDSFTQEDINFGRITYAHDAGESRNDAFRFTVSDGAGGAIAETGFALSITNVNDAPVAVNDTARAVEAGGLNNGTAGSNPSGNVLSNDTDVDAGDTKAVATTGALTGAYGTLTLNADGSYSYVVDNGNAAVQALRTSGNTLADTFTYTMRDAVGLTSTATLTITIEGGNDTPVAVNDTATAVEAGGLNNGTAGSNPNGNVLSNDTDVDADDTKTVSTAGKFTGQFGELTLNADGSYSYAVDNGNAAVQALRTSGNTLADTFTYTMTDAAGATSTATLTITIEGRNDTPVAVNDTAVAVEAGGLNNGTAGSNPSGNVLTNDTDVDAGDSKAVTTTGRFAGQFGELTLNADGSYSYVVDNGNAAVQALRTSGDKLTDTFTYTMMDAAGASSTATLTVTIRGANDTPIAVNDTAVAVEAGGLNNGTAGSNPSGNVLTNDTDVDSGDTKTVTTTGALTGAYGTLTLNADGSYSYVVDNGNVAVQALRTSGDKLTDTFTYTMTDKAGATSTATLTVTIEGCNDTPVAVADVATAIEAGGLNNGTAGSNSSGNVLDNDTDVDNGDTKTVTTTGKFVGQFGELTMNADGSYSYVVDNGNAALQALRTSGNTLTDIFTYTMTDAVGASSTATLTVTIRGANDTPVAVNDTASAVEAGGLNNGTAGSNPSGNVLTNDTDVDAGDSKAVTTTGRFAGQFGELTLNADGSYSYVVDNGNAAVQALRTSGDKLTDTFTYTMMDAAGASSTATLTVTIRGANDTPIAVNDTAVAVEAGGLSNGTAGSNPSGNVLTNDTDVDSGDTKTVTTTGALTGAYGTLTLNADGSYSYVVDNGNAAVQALRTSGDKLTDTFTYTMTDTAGATSTATLTVTIRGANDTPIAVNDTAVAVEAGGLNNGTAGSNPSGNVLDNDTDVDSGDSKAVTTTGALTGAYGTLTLNADGSYSYVVDNGNPAVQAMRTSGNTLTDTFTYTMTDAAGATSTATLTVSIRGANDTPVAVNDTAVAVEAGGLNNGTAGSNPSGNVLTNDTDVDAGDTKTVTTTGKFVGQFGELTLNADGSYSYVVDNGNATVQALRTSGDTLTDTFTYTMTDTAGTTSTATLTVTIEGRNDAPTNVTAPRIDGDKRADGTLRQDGVLRAHAGTWREMDAGDAATTFTYQWQVADDANGTNLRDIDAATATEYAVRTGDVGKFIRLKIVASDDSISSSPSYSAFAQVTNSDPVLVKAPASQRATEAVPFSFTLDAGTFADGNAEDALVYSARLADGSPLPNWLVFDPATRTFSGMPNGGDIGTLKIRVTADDHGGRPVSVDFEVMVAGVPTSVPTTTGPTAPAMAPQIIVPDPAPVAEKPADTGSGSLAAASNFSSPSLSVATQVLADTPASRPAESTNTAGLTRSEGFRAVVSDTSSKDPVLLVSNVPEQVVTKPAEVLRVVIAPDTFTHNRLDALINLNATLASGAPLPAWMKFNPVKGEITGIPPEGYVGDLDVKVTARDNYGNEKSVILRVRVLDSNKLSAGKPGLTAQLRAMSEQARHTQRQALTAHAREVAQQRNV